MTDNRPPTDYLVLDPAYNFGRRDADVLLATNDKAEAIEAAKDFGQGRLSYLSIKEEINKEYLPPRIKRIRLSKNNRSKFTDDVYR